MPSSLRFEHTRFNFQIKETHNIGSTRERLTAFGCGRDGIKYSILDERVQFKIHPHSGKISLKERLNYTKQAEHSFIVQAVANNKNCKNVKAITWVIFSVSQHNVYRPQFNADKYYCRIQEETGHVKISPEIKVTDRDPGPAGKISQVQVRESSEPFVLELEEATGKLVEATVCDPLTKFSLMNFASLMFFYRTCILVHCHSDKCMISKLLASEQICEKHIFRMLMML